MTSSHRRRYALALTLALGPPAAFGTATGGWISRHPLKTILLLCFYEVGLLVANFAGGVGSKLQARWQERAADAIDTLLWRRISRFERDYSSTLQHLLRTVDPKGLLTYAESPLRLSEVFVELSVRPQPIHKIPVGLLSALPDPLSRPNLPANALAQSAAISALPNPLSEGRHSLWDFLANHTDAPVVFALVGAPGSGKTTLLHHVALCLLAPRGHRKSLSLPRALPMILYLRDHAAAIESDPDVSIPQLLTRGLLTRVTEPPGWFKNQLDAGKCLVMLDGLDEVGDPGTRYSVARWIDRQISTYPRNNYLITSRPYGYTANPLREATVLHVHPFSLRQIEAYVRRWYEATRNAKSDDYERRSTKAVEEASDDLIDRIRSNHGLRTLAANPLLLWMIANVHYYRKALPGSRAELYEEVCQVFLGRRQGSKGIVEPVQSSKLRTALECLAAKMMCDRVRDIDRSEAESALAPILSAAAIDLAPADFLTGVETLTSGLLSEREAGYFSFAHLTFQEYLAACFYAEADMSEELVRHVDETWWHEVMRLYATRADATPVVEACLSRNGPSESVLLLAVECCRTARRLSTEASARVGQLVDYNGDDPTLRRIAARVRLYTRTREMVSIGEEVYIDPGLVTNGEYKLFLADAGVGRNPVHWEAINFRLLDAESDGDAVRGIRSTDAGGFCEWLSRDDPENWKYRLPTCDEHIARSLLQSLEEGPALNWVTIGDRIIHSRSPGSIPSLGGQLDLQESLRNDCLAVRNARTVLDQELPFWPHVAFEPAMEDAVADRYASGRRVGGDDDGRTLPDISWWEAAAAVVDQLCSVADQHHAVDAVTVMGALEGIPVAATRLLGPGKGVELSRLAVGVKRVAFNALRRPGEDSQDIAVTSFLSELEVVLAPNRPSRLASCAAARVGCLYLATALTECTQAHLLALASSVTRETAPRSSELRELNAKLVRDCLNGYLACTLLDYQFRGLLKPQEGLRFVRYMAEE